MESLFILLISFSMSCFVKEMSINWGLLWSSLCLKKSLGSPILKFGLGIEKLDEYCSDSFLEMFNKSVIILLFILNGPIELFVLMYFLAKVKKCFGLVLMFSMARDSSLILWFFREDKSSWSIFSILFSMKSLLLADICFLNSFALSFFFLLSNIRLSLGMFFLFAPFSCLNLGQCSYIIVVIISKMTFSFSSEVLFFSSISNH